MKMLYCISSRAGLVAVRFQASGGSVACMISWPTSCLSVQARGVSIAMMD